jgi:hypothetical protein
LVTVVFLEQKLAVRHAMNILPVKEILYV